MGESANRENPGKWGFTGGWAAELWESGRSTERGVWVRGDGVLAVWMRDLGDEGSGGRGIWGTRDLGDEGFGEKSRLKDNHVPGSRLGGD